MVATAGKLSFPRRRYVLPAHHLQSCSRPKLKGHVWAPSQRQGSVHLSRRQITCFLQLLGAVEPSHARANDHHVGFNSFGGGCARPGSPAALHCQRRRSPAEGVGDMCRAAQRCSLCAGKGDRCHGVVPGRSSGLTAPARRLGGARGLGRASARCPPKSNDVAIAN